MANEVSLIELDVITRWSLAVRQPTADRDELIATLRSDLAYLEGEAAAAADVPAAITPAARPAKAPRVKVAARRRTTTTAG